MLVGRGLEMDSLLRLVAEPVPGSSAALVIGPPGIGKTRLCEELAQEARRRGVRVAWGRAWEFGGAPPFLPWTRALEALAAVADEARPALESVLTRLSGSDDAGARARLDLFEAVRRAIVEASARARVLVVLDDLHASDAATVELAVYLARELRDARALVLATARDAEPEASSAEVRARLLDLARAAARTHTLGGLDEVAVASWLPWLGAGSLPETLAHALVEITGGNPFFVRELFEASRGDLGALASGRATVPRGVREVITRQLAQVEPDAREILCAVAVVGRSAPVALVARALDVAPTQVMDAARRGIDARLVEPSSSASEVAFVHALVRDAVYDSLPAARQLALHAKIATTLEPAKVSERARHALAAAPLDAAHRGRAIEACTLAGAHATRSLAFEEAARHFEDALDLLASDHDAELRVDLLVRCGEARLASGLRAAAARWFDEAAELARTLDDPRPLARAAIGSASSREYMTRDVERLRLLELAHERMAGDESALAARLAARLANDLAMEAGARTRRAELGARAVRMARVLGDPVTTALALEARLEAVYGPDSVDERLETADELLVIARARGDADREVAALRWKLSALLERGDCVAAVPLAEEHARLADLRRQPGPRINARSRLALLAFLAGRWDEGFSAAREAHALGLEGDSGAELLHRAQIVLPLEMLGRNDGLDAGLEVLARDGPRMFTPHMVLALRARALSALRRDDEAHGAIEPLAANAFAIVPDDFVRVGTLACLADVVARVGDVALAGTLVPLLAPYASRNATFGTAGSLGSVARSLGLLAALIGRDDDAERWLREGLAKNVAMGAWPWVAWTEDELATVLERRGETKEATELHASARRRAARLEMTPLVARIDARTAASAVVPRAPSPPRPTPTSTPREPRIATLHRAPEKWVLEQDGRSLSVPDRRGLGYLARLLARPGEEVHALELVSGSADLRESAGEPVLDAKAKAQLVARVAALRAKIEDAESEGRKAAAERARAELETLEDHMIATLGLGGRTRKMSGAAERARSAVTVALRRAIEGVATVSPEAAAHLARSVRTGVFCAYDPDPQSALRVTSR